ncbi:hypothetical protein JKP88DRAFT_288774 [Tribonema minus]|uniref:Uncharacterized protein n=1 Tax=Tribonema minus TaxID=303371 RepID=A0A835ZAG2_9STRA|nr:hypothetical protein JKP88DRAFT_288774 [Tribonema minus]
MLAPLMLDNGVTFTPEMVHSTLSALKKDHKRYLDALGLRAGRFFDCLASNVGNSKASPVFSTDFTTPVQDLCKTCGGKTGAALDACVDEKDGFVTDSSCGLTVFAPYYENDPGGAHFDALFKDPEGKITDETLGMVAAICNDGHCYNQLYDSVQALLKLMHDGGSCLNIFASTSSATDLGGFGEGMDMARGVLRLLCAFSSPPKGSSAQPVSCFKTLETITGVYNETDKSATVAALCPSAANNALAKSGCCMREIMAGAPPMGAPAFWTDVDAACGLNLADTDPHTMLQFCPDAHGSAQSFVIGLHIAGADVCSDDAKLSAVIEASAAALSIEASQVTISSCTYSAARTRVLHARRLAVGTSDVGVTVTAIGSAQIDAMDACKAAALSPAFPAAIATSLSLSSSSVTADSALAGEMSAEGTSSAPLRAATAGSALVALLLAAAALVIREGDLTRKGTATVEVFKIMASLSLLPGPAWGLNKELQRDVKVAVKIISLEALPLSCGYGRLNLTLGALRHTLETLDATGVATFNSALGLLPESLTRLSLGESFDQALGTLPAALTELRIGKGTSWGFCYFNQSLGVLPPSLRVLDLHQCYRFNQPLGRLPRALWQLRLGDAFNQPLLHQPTHALLPPAFNAALAADPLRPAPDASARLPETLAVLHLGEAFDHPLGPLPEGLAELQVGSFGRDGCFSHALGPLPAALRILDLTTRAACDHALGGLPDALRELRLGGAFDQPLPQLPARLEVLALGDVFDAALPAALPCALRELHLGNRLNAPLTLTPRLEVLTVGASYTHRLDLAALSLKELHVGRKYVHALPPLPGTRVTRAHWRDT